MCTLAVQLGAPGLPVLVAANRDEALDRPSSGPALRAAKIPFIAPRDERSGGTWLGVNARGLFVGVTNRFGRPPDTTRRSRGALVWDSLGSASAAALHARLATLDPRAYNGFHLLYADSRAGFLTWADGEALHQLSLQPGLHIVTERSLGAGDARAREAFVREAWSRANVKSPDELLRLRDLLTHHDVASPLDSTCVHAPAFNYGTRSSMLLALAEPPSRSKFFWAEGAPHDHPHLERPDLIDALALR